LRAEVAIRTCPPALEELGAIVDDVPVLQKPCPERRKVDGAAAADDRRRMDGSRSRAHRPSNIFTRALICRNYETISSGEKFASIGPETSKAIRALGLEPTIEAKEHASDACSGQATLMKGTARG